MSGGLSRRRLFSLLTRPLQSGADGAAAGASEPSAPVAAGGPVAVPVPGPSAGAGAGGVQATGLAVEARVAVIQGRYCLAYSEGCTLCAERCPVPGAMKVDHGIPMVVPDVCTGCGECHQVCPAPRNAVLMLPRRPGGAR